MSGRIGGVKKIFRFFLGGVGSLLILLPPRGYYRYKIILHLYFMETSRAMEMSLDQLSALLAEATKELLKLVEEKKDELVIRNKGREIELLCSLIEMKRERQKSH